MALAYSAGPTVIRIVYVDEHSRKSVKDYVVPTAVWDPASDLLAAIVTIRDNLVTQINLNTEALLLNAFIVVRQIEDTLSLPGSDCHVNEIASIVTNLEAGEGKKAIFQIPAPVDAMFVGASGPDKDRVDTANANLNTFIDMFQTTGGSFTISDGETIDDTTPLVSGRRIFKKTGAKPQS